MTKNKVASAFAGIAKLFSAGKKKKRMFSIENFIVSFVPHFQISDNIWQSGLNRVSTTDTC